MKRLTCLTFSRTYAGKTTGGQRPIYDWSLWCHYRGLGEVINRGTDDEGHWDWSPTSDLWKARRNS